MNPLERENKYKENNANKTKPHHKALSMNWKEQILSAGSTEKTYTRSECFQPSPRMNHCSAFYKNKIYIWGGDISQLDSSSSSLFLYAYQLDSNTWKRLWTKSSCKDLEALQGQCQVVINNRWYMYGGRNKAGIYPSQLWRLNLDALEWVKCEQKGELPNPTQGGQLIAFQKNYLLHYQGFNSFSHISSHAVSIYSVEAKTWHRCEGNYEYCLQFRIGTSLCLQNNKIFMFGGAYEAEDGFQYFNDLHELIVNTSKANKSLDSKVISNQTPVPRRAEHFLFPLAKDYLCLIGGRNAQEFFADIWIYNLRSETWTQDGISNFLSQRSIGYSCVIGGEEIFFFGGLKQDNDKIEITNALWSIEVQSRLPYIQDDIDNTEASFSHACCICSEKRNKFLFASKQFSSQYIQDYKTQIEFPFAAFGLLLDNCLLSGATEIILEFDLDANGLYYIKIQDNGKFIWQQKQFLPNLAAFCCQNQMILMGCDKKVKKQILRSNHIKEYGVNLKLGCLRLGKRFLLISYNADILRVCLFDEQSTNDQSEDRQYTVRYFAWNQSTKELIDANMSKNQQYIEHEYRKYIRDVLASKMSKSVVYIFDTILDDEDEDLKCRKDLNDIYFGSNESIIELEKKGYYMSESIDVSLKAYLSCLFLKNENLSLHLSFGGVLTVVNLPINLQGQLQQIDKLSKSGFAVELQGLVEFDFRFAEFYFLRDFKPNFRFFNNGALLYYKNRLINRHKPALGDMIPFLLQQETFNNLPFFGFAQLPQNIPHNASKTNFTFTIMLEKMYSRLKFVEESFKVRNSKLLGIEYLPHPKPKLDNPSEEAIIKIRRYFRDLSEQQRLKKRPSDRNNEETIVRKRSKKLERADFTPPTYKLRQMDHQNQIRRTRQHNVVVNHPEPSLQVLIEHEDSSIQQIQQTDHKTSR